MLVKERPILFNTDMVNAEKEGRKTQTRRTRGLDLINENPDHYRFRGFITKVDRNLELHAVFEEIHGGETQIIRSPYGKKGDQLWVRETFGVWGQLIPVTAVTARFEDCLFYKADNPKKPESAKWKPSIFMPRKYSRIQLEITDIRVERLNDISDGDCYEEGIETWLEDEKNHPKYSDGTLSKFNNIKQAFQALWESINGKGSWDENPWVWVIGFKRIDAQEAAA